MEPERFKRLEELYQAAEGLPPLPTTSRSPTGQLQVGNKRFDLAGHAGVSLLLGRLPERWQGSGIL